MRFIIRVMTAAVIAASTSAYAQSTLDKPECSNASITGIEQKIARMKDGPQKKTASIEIEAAKNMLSNKKIEDCQDHLLKATLQTK